MYIGSAKNEGSHLGVTDMVISKLIQEALDASPLAVAFIALLVVWEALRLVRWALTRRRGDDA